MATNHDLTILEERIEKLSVKAESLETEIHEACCGNETQKVITILKRKRKEINTKEIDDNGSLYVAVQNENATIVKGLLKVGCNPNITNSKIDKMIKCPLFLAIEKVNLKILKLLLEYDGDTNLEYMNGETPLHFAIEQGSIDIVKELLIYGADCDADDCHEITPLLRALQNNRIDIAKILLEYDADINIPCFSEGHTALH